MANPDDKLDGDVEPVAGAPTMPVEAPEKPSEVPPKAGTLVMVPALKVKRLLN